MSEPTQPSSQPPTQPFGPQPAEPTDHPAPSSTDPWAPPAGARPEPRRVGVGSMVGTAAAAALVASLATAGLTGAFTDEASSSPVAVEATDGGDNGPTNVPVSGSTADLPDWQAVADAVRPSVVAIDVRTRSGAGQGSGVILDTEGHVLTNDHVVGDAVDDGLAVTLHDGRVLEAEIVGLDPTTDLAVIRLLDPPDDLRPAELGDSDAVTVGAPVMAVGNPLGLDSTVTTGIVSALDRPVSTQGETSPVVTNAIQVDAAVNPGNSGGPLFDAQGRVIGITSSIAALSGGQSGSIGLGFAIPSNLAERVAGELVEDGVAEHAFLGVALSDGTVEVDGASRRGAVVEEVTEGSPADEAGIDAGDVVVAVDGDPVSGAESLTATVREHAAGDTATLTVVRDGDRTELEVTFAVRDEDAVQDEYGDDGRRGSDEHRGEGRRGSDERPDRGAFPWDWFGRG